MLNWLRPVLAIVAMEITGYSHAANCPVVPPQLEQAVHMHAKQIRALEYCEARTVKSRGQVTIAIYTLEGACGELSREEPGTCSVQWVRYMVGLIRGAVIGPIRIGGKGDFTDQQINLSGDSVSLAGVTIGPNDALCCPSVSETKNFWLSQRGFRESRQYKVAKPDYASALPALRAFVARYGKTSANTFYIGKADVGPDDQSAVYAYWQEDNSILILTPHFNQQDVDSDLLAWLYTKARIDLNKGVVPTEADIHGSTYLVDKPWVDHIIGICLKGDKITVEKDADTK